MFKCKLPELKYSSYLPRHDWKIGSQLKSRTIHFFVLWKINFFKAFFSKLCFFNFSMFEITHLIIKSQKQTFAFVKWFTINISNSSLLLTYSFHYLMKNLFSVPISNPYQIILHSFIAKFNASMKIPLTKYSLRFLTRFWSGSRLWKNCPLILFHGKQISLKDLLRIVFFQLFYVWI